MRRPSEMVQYLNAQREAHNTKIMREQFEEANKSIEESNKAIQLQDKLNSIEEKRMTPVVYSKFIETVKEFFLSEALYTVFNECVDSTSSNLASDGIKRNYISTFIKESGGASKVLVEMKYASPLLSSYHLLIEKATKKALDCVDKNDKDTFVIDTEVKSEFLDDLDELDIEDISETIKTKVSNSVAEMLDNNSRDRDAIEDIVNTTKEKSSATNKEDLKEHYNMMATRQINEIKNRRSKSIFESMVRFISRNGMKEKSLSNLYLNESGGLNMDNIMTSAIVMYTFLEFCNTTRLDVYDEEKVSELYEVLNK